MVTKRGREMAELLAVREREGLTYEELAERTGIARATLSWWSWRLRRDERAELVPVEIVEPPAPASTGVAVEVGAGVVVHVAHDFDAATLDRVMSVLARRC